MTAEKIKNRVGEICSHFTFDYNGKCCGVDPLSRNNFDMWCGDENFNAKSLDEVMNTKLFDGECLNDIADKIEIDEW